jgi:hypothetical protein
MNPKIISGTVKSLKKPSQGCFSAAIHESVILGVFPPILSYFICSLTGRRKGAMLYNRLIQRGRLDDSIRLLLFSVFLLQFASMITNAECDSPTFITSDPNGGWSDGGYYVHNNMWNSDADLGPETLYACSYKDWHVISNQSNDAGAVKTYPNVHKDYNKVAISSFNYLTSTFAATSPHVGIYNVAYDIWLNGVATAGSNEVMIWTENYNQVPAGTKVDTVTMDGRAYNVWKTNGGAYIAFVPTSMVTSGSIDLLGILKWIISKGWIPSGSTIGQICFGVEIVSTNGTNAKFAFTDFSINTSPTNVVVKKTGFRSAAKSPAIRNGYYSLSGKRFDSPDYPAPRTRRGNP